MNKNIVATLIIAMGASGALAESHTIAPSASDWSGAYAGLSYSSIDGTMNYSNFSTEFEYEETSSIGFFGGYNLQNGDFVYGGELSFMSGLDGIVGFPDEELDNIVAVRGRVGYAVGSALAYGFVGYATSGYDNSSDSWDVAGTSFGAGVDYKLPNNLFVGAEISQTEMEGDTNNAGQTQTNSIAAITLRAAYRF